MQGAHSLYCGRLGVDVPKFWTKIDKRKDGCWIWTRGKYNHGYGSVVWRFKPNGRGQMIAASRAAWMVTHGPIPEGMQVLHKCDVPACCNPTHLFLGTHSDNMRDMRNKVRVPGTLNREKVLRVRKLLKTKTGADVARVMGILPTTISAIKCGRSYNYFR